MPWHRIAGVIGASAVGAAAFNAHGITKVLEKRGVPKQDIPALAKSFDNGVKWHTSTALALLAVPIMKRPTVTGPVLLAGGLLFTGSCYAAALTGDKKNGKLAPYGGMLMIAGWLSLVL